jgi:hypothetical protein
MAGKQGFCTPDSGICLVLSKLSIAKVTDGIRVPALAPAGEAEIGSAAARHGRQIQKSNSLHYGV